MHSIGQRRLCFVLAGLVLLAAVGSGLAVWRHKRYRHFAVHDPGKVYRSAWVEAGVFRELIPRYGVRTVVNLCYPDEMGAERTADQREAVSATGARLIELPFPPNYTWETSYPSVQEFERILDDPASYPIWIHCQHGRERTVKALAIYDIYKRRLTAQQSLTPMPRFGMDHPWPVVVFAFNYQAQRCPAVGPAEMLDRGQQLAAPPAAGPTEQPTTGAAANLVDRGATKLDPKSDAPQMRR